MAVTAPRTGTRRRSCNFICKIRLEVFLFIYFCAIDDPSSFLQTEIIGVDNIMVESDYPHADCTWPHTQDKLYKQVGKLPDSSIERITWRNAAELFDLKIPQSVSTLRASCSTPGAILTESYLTEPVTRKRVGRAPSAASRS